MAKTNLSRKVVDSDRAKYRCHRAFVNTIRDKFNGQEIDTINSDFNDKFVYRKSEEIIEPQYDPNINIVCTKRIHFYITQTAFYHNIEPTIKMNTKELLSNYKNGMIMGNKTNNIFKWRKKW